MTPNTSRSRILLAGVAAAMSMGVGGNAFAIDRPIFPDFFGRARRQVARKRPWKTWRSYCKRYSHNYVEFCTQQAQQRQSVRLAKKMTRMMECRG